MNRRSVPVPVVPHLLASPATSANLGGFAEALVLDPLDLMRDLCIRAVRARDKEPRGPLLFALDDHEIP